MAWHESRSPLEAQTETETLKTAEQHPAETGNIAIECDLWKNREDEFGELERNQTTRT